MATGKRASISGRTRSRKVLQLQLGRNAYTQRPFAGPESLSFDISFPTHGHVYGLPQHAMSFNLPTTTGKDAHFSDPIRLYNGDVYEYDADSTISLYGSIPMLHAHSASSTVAVFDAVGSDTFIDMYHPTEKSTATQWISESGILDLFIIPGPTPQDIFAQYTGLTGRPAMPMVTHVFGEEDYLLLHQYGDQLRTLRRYLHRYLGGVKQFETGLLRFKEIEQKATHASLKRILRDPEHLEQHLHK